MKFSAKGEKSFSISGYIESDGVIVAREKLFRGKLGNGLLNYVKAEVSSFIN